MAEPIDDVASARAAVSVVTSAYREAARQIREISDPDAAFTVATELGASIVALGNSNAGLRADMLAAVRQAHKLDAARALAEHVTKTGIPMTRQRVEQVLAKRSDHREEGAAA